MAKMLDENTISGFSVTPKTAGIESTAKTTSEISTAIMHRSIGVASFSPRSLTVKKLSPSYLSVDLNNELLNLTIQLFSKFSCEGEGEGEEQSEREMH